MDYLCEVNSVKIMQKFLHLNEFDFNDGIYVNRALQSNIHVQNIVDVITVDLSVLENVDFRTNNEDQEAAINIFIAQIVDKIENNNRNFIDFSEMINLLEHLEVSQQAITIFDMIQLIIVRLDNLNNRDDDYNFIVRRIREYIKRIPEALGRVYMERFKVLRGIVRHARLWKEYRQTTLVMIAISQRKYDEDKKLLIGTAVESMENMITKMIVPSDLDKGSETFEYKLTQLEKSINTKILNDPEIVGFSKKIREKYTEKQGCFGIMELNEDLNYFSLSGTMDYYGSKWKVKNYMQFKRLKAIIMSLFDLKKYQYFPMMDDTLRYKKDLNNNYLPIELVNDTEGDFEKIKQYYSCCERKMQARYNDYTCAKIFYSRWEPCDGCIPALKREAGKIRVFALAKNFKDWEKNKSKFRECDLIELGKKLGM